MTEAEWDAVVPQTKGRAATASPRGAAAGVGSRPAFRQTVDPAFASRVIFEHGKGMYDWHGPDGPATADEVVARMADQAMASLLGSEGREREEA